MQSMARKNEWPLDKMCLQCDVTKKHREDFSSPPREGCLRWDKASYLMEPELAVIFRPV